MEQHGSASRQTSRQQYDPQQPAGPPSTAGGDAQQLYGFIPGARYSAGAPMQPSPVTYLPAMQGPETPRHQPQQYPQYGSNLMYMNQPSPSQFGVAGAAQYYLTGQTGPQSSELGSQHLPTPFPPSDQYTETQTYSMDPSQQSSVYGAYPQQQQQYPAQHQQQHHQQPQLPSTEEAFEAYQTQIRTIFTLARDGALRDVAPRLLETSRYLLGNVENLGLTRDDEVLHDGRIRLWDEFNLAWLVTLQRQLDLAENMMQARQPLAANQSVMDASMLERLCGELVRLCDNIEKHGLVDYQMGVAEEEIMDMLLRCLSIAYDDGAAEGQAESSRAGASRRRGG